MYIMQKFVGCWFREFVFRLQAVQGSYFRWYFSTSLVFSALHILVLPSLFVVSLENTRIRIADHKKVLNLILWPRLPYLCQLFCGIDEQFPQIFFCFLGLNSMYCTLASPPISHVYYFSSLAEKYERIKGWWAWFAETNEHECAH